VNKFDMYESLQQLMVTNYTSLRKSQLNAAAHRSTLTPGHSSQGLTRFLNGPDACSTAWIKGNISTFQSEHIL
jgi:hypothetical protein